MFSTVWHMSNMLSLLCKSNVHSKVNDDDITVSILSAEKDILGSIT